MHVSWHTHDTAQSQGQRTTLMNHFFFLSCGSWYSSFATRLDIKYICLLGHFLGPEIAFYQDASEIDRNMPLYKTPKSWEIQSKLSKSQILTSVKNVLSSNEKLCEANMWWDWFAQVYMTLEKNTVCLYWGFFIIIPRVLTLALSNIQYERSLGRLPSLKPSNFIYRVKSKTSDKHW